MGEYLETEEAQDIVLAWVREGAIESGWPSAKAVLDAHCVTCHNPEGVQGLVRLDRFRSAARVASLPPSEPRPFGPPAAVLAVAAIALGVITRRG